MTAHGFECYRHSDAAHLSDDEREVLRVVREARGFFISRGLSMADILNRLGLYVDDVALRDVVAIVATLVAKDLVRLLPNGNVRRK